ncbi:MAG: hypothetical protein A2Y38_10815 [Spirochaetes bacterium GWB1_59_5]|nr:MAG: hypothetical protein A2Y38_10815 [Spirochaetes bacterium GWB1_59_5]
MTAVRIITEVKDDTIHIPNMGASRENESSCSYFLLMMIEKNFFTHQLPIFHVPMESTSLTIFSMYARRPPC